jgi:hypothetical protein
MSTAGDGSSAAVGARGATVVSCPTAPQRPLRIASRVSSMGCAARWHGQARVRAARPSPRHRPHVPRVPQCAGPWVRPRQRRRSPCARRRAGRGAPPTTRRIARAPSSPLSLHPRRTACAERLPHRPSGAKDRWRSHRSGALNISDRGHPNPRPATAARKRYPAPQAVSCQARLTSAPWRARNSTRP